MGVFIMGNEADDKSKKQEIKKKGRMWRANGKSTIVKLFNNWISYFGVFIASVMALLISLNIGLTFFAGLDNPYGGVFVYILFLPLMVFGLILIPIGMYRNWRNWQRSGEIPYHKWPYVDFNVKSYRIAAFIFLNATILFVLISGVVSYEAYHFTESLEFCGEMCHEVMHPEAVAYANSPHARVGCSHCHIGSGVSYYTKSKLSGAYQLYAVTFKTYPKPIPTPLENLRPAQETCEKCHWPEQFFGAQQKQFNYYSYDEENTHWPVNMLIKTGGGDPKTGQTSGIHWHMNIGTKVEYIARDEKRQDIPWVKITDKTTGRVTIYQDENEPLTEEEIAAATPRLMDCMDCHNRPSHQFQSPDSAVNKAILTGQIDTSIPYIKRVAVEAMTQDLDNGHDASQKIANYITEYYRIEMPEVYREKRVEIDKAIISTQKAYGINIFPEMKVKWTYYFDNIGHLEYPGCMRCHLGDHKDENGIPITHECKDCHIILSQGSGENFEASDSPDGLDFKHPKDISKIWDVIGCYKCHKGVQP
jgi:hypothetical protein